MFTDFWVGAGKLSDLRKQHEKKKISFSQKVAVTGGGGRVSGRRAVRSTTQSH